MTTPTTLQRRFGLRDFISLFIFANVTVLSFCRVEAVNSVANTMITSRRAIPKKNLQHPNEKAFPTIAMRGGQVVNKAISTESAVRFGMLLALNSGFINGLCLSGILASDGVKQASAAVTGAWTNSALGFASGNREQFNLNAKCILSYMFGSCISGALNPNPVPFVLGSGSAATFFVGAALLFASSSIASKSGARSFLYLAAIANGMQNSYTSTTTSNLVRSAHFSGTTSDMGTFIGQILRGNTKNADRLKVLTRVALSFWVGGFISYYSGTKLAGANLLISAGLYLVIGLALTFMK